MKEEVGVTVGNVRYFGSQPWPFPNSLMVGFTAEWESGEIVVDAGRDHRREVVLRGMRSRRFHLLSALRDASSTPGSREVSTNKIVK